MKTRTARCFGPCKSDPSRRVAPPPTRCKPTVMEAVESRVLMSGTVLDDYQMAAGKTASSHEIVEDAAGNLFVAGGAVDAAGAHHALVRQGTRQADGSISWGAAPVINYSLNSGSTSAGLNSSFNDLLIDPSSGDLYAAGNVQRPDGGRTDWVVLKRSAADGTVTVVDTYRYADDLSAWANGIAMDGSGNIFVAGAASSRWIVRELKAGGSAFQTVQDAYVDGGTNCRDIVAAPSGLYAVGYGNGYWLTQRGVPDGTGTMSWTTVDAFKADPNYGSLAHGVGVDGAGNIYSTGSGTRSTGVKKRGQMVTVIEWTVRRSTDAGASWASIDRFALSSSTGRNVGEDFGTDPAGNLYVSGYGPGSDGIPHAVVRWAKPDGTGWATLDDWQLTAGQSAFATGFFADSRGALYTAGNANADSSNVRHAIIRRIDPPAGVSTTFSQTMISDTSTTEEETTTVGGAVLA